MKKRLNEMGLRIHAAMTACRWRVAHYLKDQKGAGAVEYAMIVAVVVLGLVAAATLMFPTLKQFFQDVAQAVADFFKAHKGT